MSGGKGGSSTSTVQIPEYIEAAAQRNLNKAERISQIPYAPQYGPDVAAFTPMQQAGFQGTAQAASAFGVPGGGMSQRDIMGGMDAPMRYAGGVQGYSSAPIFQQSVDELARQRPALKSYIDSFFIDPVSGQYAYQPFDYTTINTMAEDQRQQAAADRGNERAIAQMQASGGGGAGDGFGGFGSSGLNAALPGGVNDPFLGSPISQGIARATTRDQGPTAPVTSPRPVQRPDRDDGRDGFSSSSLAPTTSSRPSQRPDRDGGSSSSSDDGGTVMCTAYCEMGYLPKEIWHLDRRYGVRVYRNDPALIEGYHVWGVPLANYIRKDTLGAKVLRAVMWPVVKAWAEEMAHNMKPSKYKPNYFGKLIKFVGEPLSRMCVKLKPRKIEGVA
jgi:hypothetical protein